MLQVNKSTKHKITKEINSYFRQPGNELIRSNNADIGRAHMEIILDYISINIKSLNEKQEFIKNYTDIGVLKPEHQDIFKYMSQSIVGIMTEDINLALLNAGYSLEYSNPKYIATLMPDNTFNLQVTTTIKRLTTFSIHEAPETVADLNPRLAEMKLVINIDLKKKHAKILDFAIPDISAVQDKNGHPPNLQAFYKQIIRPPKSLLRKILDILLAPFRYIASLFIKPNNVSMGQQPAVASANSANSVTTPPLTTTVPQNTASIIEPEALQEPAARDSAPLDRNRSPHYP